MQKRDVDTIKTIALSIAVAWMALYVGGILLLGLFNCSSDNYVPNPLACEARSHAAAVVVLFASPIAG